MHLDPSTWPSASVLVTACFIYTKTHETKEETASRSEEQGPLPYLCLHLLLRPAVVFLILVGSQNLLLDAEQDCLTAITPTKETTSPELQKGLGALLRPPSLPPHPLRGLHVPPPLPGLSPLHCLQKTAISEQVTQGTWRQTGRKRGGFSEYSFHLQSLYPTGKFHTI